MERNMKTWMISKTAKSILSKVIGIGLATSMAFVGATTTVYAKKITLHGASQFDETHSYTRLMRRFE
jgi:hypothetical protein